MVDAAREEDAMLRDIRATPELIPQIHRALDLGTRRALDHDDITGLRRVLLTGCGDSHFAGVAAAPLVERLSGLPANAVPSMDASRYLLPLQADVAPRRLLTVGVTVSGEVSRTVEALRRATGLGALTCAVTGSAASRAGTAAERVVAVELPPKQGSGHIPGTRSYTASMLTLYLLAIHMAEVRDRISVTQANAMGRRLLDASAEVRDVIDASDDVLRELAGKWADATSVVVAGSGPNFATAQFLAAKIIEATGVQATPSDIEEWAHLYYFVSDPSQVTIVIAPHGAVTGRAAELIDLMRRRGRRLLLVTTADSPLASDRSDTLVVAPSMSELLSPFVLHAGLSLYAGHLANARDSAYFNGFPPDPSPEGNTIVRSQVVDEVLVPDADLVPDV